MRTTRSEAINICRLWAADRSFLRCDLSLTRFAASFRGRVTGFANDTLTLLSDDTTTELAFLFTTDLEFAYADPRNFPAEADVFERGLVVFFPTEPDMASFLELKDLRS